MKVLQKILYAIGAIILFMLLLILISVFKPDFADKLGNLVGKAERVFPDGESGNQTKVNVTVDGNPADSGNNDTQNGSDAASGIDQMTGDCIAVTDRRYEMPARDAVRVPRYVSGKNGYFPATDSGEILDDITAEEVKNRLSVGETGENLDFDATIYPYYSMLDVTGKALYRQIYANVNALNERFAPVSEILPNGFRNAFTAVLNDHPELFWMESSYGYQFSKKGGIAGITLKFNSTADNLAAAKEVFDNNVKSILNQTAGLTTDYEKEVMIHNVLVSRTSYNLSASMNQSAYSAIVNGETVCAGYARAFQYLMQQLSVPCYYCTGYAGENHAWNIIRLDEDFYNVDTTWDDTDPVNYFFFNCSDTDFSDTHVRKELSVYLPSCGGGKYCNLLENPDWNSGLDTGTGGGENGNGAGATGDGTGGGENGNEAGATGDGNDNGTGGNGVTGDGNGSENGNGTEASGDGSDENSGQSDAFKNTLEDYGLSASDAVTSLEDYGVECYNNLLESNGTAAYFTTVIKGKALWNQIFSEYQSGDYKGLYMQSAMDQLEIKGCDMSVTSEELAGGYYLVRHTFYAR